MASLGTASLVLSANGSQLTQGLEQAQRQISNFASQAQAKLSGAFSFAGAAGFGAIAAGIAAAVGLITTGFSRLETIAGQTKTALSLGIDPSQYQALGLVLSRAGIDASQAGDFFGSFAEKMEKAARTGRGPVAAAMQTLGVDLAHLRSMPLDQQFLEVAEAMSKVPPGAQQAAMAMSVFGSTALLPQLQQGRAGLESFMNAARANGEILSSSEMEAAQKASKAWIEAKKSLTKAWESVSLSVASALGPLVTTAAEIFKNIVQAARPVIDGIGEAFRTAIEVVGPVFTMIVTAVKDVIQWIGQLVGNVGVQFPSIREVVLSVFQAIATVGAYTWDTLKAGVGGLAVAISYLVEAIGNVADAYNALQGITTHYANAGVAVRRWGTEAVTTWGNSATAVNRYFDNLRRRQNEAAAAPPVRPPAIQRPNEGFEYKATAAFLQGSKEAYSIEVQAKLASQLGVAPADLQERAVDAAEEQVAVLRDIRERLPDNNEGNTLRAV